MNGKAYRQTRASRESARAGDEKVAGFVAEVQLSPPAAQDTGRRPL